MRRISFQVKGRVARAVATPGEVQRQVDHQLRSWPPRRIASWTLMLLGLLIAAQHLLSHGGFRPLPLSMGWQDILIGYPTAMLLAIVGAILIDPRPRL